MTSPKSTQFKPTIFISYRRKKNKEPSSFVSRMDKLLSLPGVVGTFNGLGWDVFLDKHGLRAGPFAAQIHNNIDTREFFFLILEKHTLNAKENDEKSSNPQENANLPSRFMNPDDWVRRELEYALAQNRSIFCILAHDFSWKHVDEQVLDDETIRELRNYLDKNKNQEIRFPKKISKKYDEVPEFKTLENSIQKKYEEHRHIFLLYETMIDETGENPDNDKADKIDEYLSIQTSEIELSITKIDDEYSNNRNEEEMLKCGIILFILSKKSKESLKNAKSTIVSLLEKAIETNKIIIPISTDHTYLKIDDVPASLSPLIAHQAYSFEDREFYQSLARNITELYAGVIIPNAMHEARSLYLNAQKNISKEENYPQANEDFKRARKRIPRWGHEFGLTADMVYLSHVELLLKWETEDNDKRLETIKAILEELLKKVPAPKFLADRRRRAKIFTLLDTTFVIKGQEKTGIEIAHELYQEIVQDSIDGTSDYFQGAITREWGVIQFLYPDSTPLPVLETLDKLLDFETDEQRDMYFNNLADEDKYWLGWGLFCRAEAYQNVREEDEYEYFADITPPTIRKDLLDARKYLPEEQSPLTRMPIKSDAARLIAQLNDEMSGAFFDGRVITSLETVHQKLSSDFKNLQKLFDTLHEANHLHAAKRTRQTLEQMRELAPKINIRLRATDIQIRATSAIYLAATSDDPDLFSEAYHLLDSTNKDVDKLLEEFISKFEAIDTADDDSDKSDISQEMRILKAGLYNVKAGLLSNLLQALGKYWETQNDPPSEEHQKVFRDAVEEGEQAIKNLRKSLETISNLESLDDQGIDPDECLARFLMARMIGEQRLGNDVAESRTILANIRSKKQIIQDLQNKSLQVEDLYLKRIARPERIHKNQIETIEEGWRKVLVQLEWANNLYYQGTFYKETAEALKESELLAEKHSLPSVQALLYQEWGESLRSQAMTLMSLISESKDDKQASKLLSEADSRYDKIPREGEKVPSQTMNDSWGGKQLISGWQAIIAEDWKKAIEKAKIILDTLEDKKVYKYLYVEAYIIELIALNNTNPNGTQTERIKTVSKLAKNTLGRPADNHAKWLCELLVKFGSEVSCN